MNFAPRGLLLPKPDLEGLLPELLLALALAWHRTRSTIIQSSAMTTSTDTVKIGTEKRFPPTKPWHPKRMVLQHSTPCGECKSKYARPVPLNPRSYHHVVLVLPRDWRLPPSSDGAAVANGSGGGGCAGFTASGEVGVPRRNADGSPAYAFSWLSGERLLVVGRRRAAGSWGAAWAGLGCVLNTPIGVATEPRGRTASGPQPLLDCPYLP